MNNSIEIALKSLTENVLSEIQAANAETEAAKSHYAGIFNGIFALVADMPTYSNEGEVVLDNTIGSRSTLLAATRTGRQGVGIEQDSHWFNVAAQRIATELPPPTFAEGDSEEMRSARPLTAKGRCK